MSTRPVFDIFYLMANPMNVSITGAYLANQSLCILLSNRQKWRLDLALYYNAAPAAAALSERSYAVRLKIGPKEIRWPNGFRISVSSILAHGTLDEAQAA